MRSSSRSREFQRGIAAVARGESRGLSWKTYDGQVTFLICFSVVRYELSCSQSMFVLPRKGVDGGDSNHQSFRDGQQTNANGRKSKNSLPFQDFFLHNNRMNYLPTSSQIEKWYSLRFILDDSEMDISRRKIHLDTSI